MSQAYIGIGTYKILIYIKENFAKVCACPVNSRNCKNMFFFAQQHVEKERGRRNRKRGKEGKKEEEWEGERR